MKDVPTVICAVLTLIEILADPATSKATVGAVLLIPTLLLNPSTNKTPESKFVLPAMVCNAPLRVVFPLAVKVPPRTNEAGLSTVLTDVFPTIIDEEFAKNPFDAAPIAPDKWVTAVTLLVTFMNPVTVVLPADIVLIVTNAPLTDKSPLRLTLPPTLAVLDTLMKPVIVVLPVDTVLVTVNVPVEFTSVVKVDHLLLVLPRVLPDVSGIKLPT